MLCYLHDDRDRVLLLRRTREPNAGLYSPIGGKLDVSSGESPHGCAVREIREEAGVPLAESEVQLLGIVSEKAYQGQAHWLIFLYEVLRPVRPQEVQRMDFHEGTLEWIRSAEVLQRPIPYTDRTIIWPLVRQHQGGFFAVHIDCSDGAPRSTVLESRPRQGRP